ncbi:MAG: helix-turn-helix domain-containing protein, partial [Candidatus Poribacteria bacterium]|nr:helix-turn-helix domain-containing protein [Candidatus Poribacteria bacterium]
MEDLADSAEAIGYLDVSLEEYQIDGDTSFFLRGLRNVVEAQGGVAEVAKRTGMDPETLSKILSSEETLHLDTFATILKALGCRLSIEPLKAEACGVEYSGVDTPVAPIEDIKSEMVLSNDNK